MALHTYLSIITLTVNDLNAPTKRHSVAEWIRKQDPYICCLQETHLRSKDTHRLKVTGQKKIFHANEKEKKIAGIAVLVSDKIGFKPKVIHSKRQRRILHNDKRNTPTRGCNPSKHLHTQHRSN